ncbi:hypothetical protein ABZ722_04525 [Streptomyces longwoodensis]|uniref:terpene synthase family protein n=1 Tax=Streptomyces longwoodensis TaxID=68231 RepID=UPI0033FC6893
MTPRANPTRPRPQPSPGCRSVREHAVQSRTTASWRQRASRTWIDYLAGNLFEEANRHIGTELNLEEYVRVRNKSIGVRPDFDMRETNGRYEVPPLAWYSSHLERMRTCTVEHVIFVNDVCSLEKDEARDDVNLVRLIQQRDNCSRSAAIAQAAAAADERMREFQLLERGVPHLCKQLGLDDVAHTAVLRHVDSMIDMLSGNYHWSRTCGRYSPKAAAHLGPDRPGLLALYAPSTLQPEHVIAD